MQVKFFLYSAASLWKEDLTPLPVSLRFISEPRWSQTNLFDEVFSFGQNYLAAANLFPPLPAVIPQCRPLPPLTTGSSYAALSLLCQPWFSFTGLTLSWPRVHLLSTSPSPTLLAVAYLSCRLQPCLLSPSSLSLALTNEPPQLGNKPEQNPKIPLSQLCSSLFILIKNPFQLLVFLSSFLG